MNYYEILEVNETATEDELKKAYRTLAKKYHPDKFMSESADVQKKMEDKFVKINESYNTLSNKELRKEYDMKLKNKTGFKSSTKTNGKKTDYQDIYEKFTKDGINSMFGNFFNKEEPEKAEESEKMKNQTNSMFDSFFTMNKKGR